MRDNQFLVYFWTTLVGGAYGEFRGDLNYHTETPSPPTIWKMDGPTHVLVVSRNYWLYRVFKVITQYHLDNYTYDV